MASELACDGACCRSNRDGWQHRWGEQPDDDAHTAAPARALAAEVIAGVGDGDVAVRVLGDEDRALDLHLLVLHEPNEPVEVALGRIDVLVYADYDVHQLVCHWVPLRFAMLDLWQSPWRVFQSPPCFRRMKPMMPQAHPPVTSHADGRDLRKAPRMGTSTWAGYSQRPSSLARF